jgi:N-acetylglucosamine kinase-like BadF-type ATPase
MSIVLGVDGGGSKTHAVICNDAGEVLGAGTAGPSNWETVGLRGACDNVGDAIERSTSQGVRRADVDAIVFGLAGVDWPSDVPRLESAFQPLRLPVAPTIVNDAFVALRAGVRAPWGVVIIAGTGTVAAGRNRTGDTHRTLGLGRVLGDAGSASDVSEEGLRAVARAYVGTGAPTSLSQALCELSGAGSVAELLEEFSRGGEPELEAAALVLQHAERGDAVAIEIVEWAGDELGGAAAMIARVLGMDQEPYELVMSGGLFHGGSELLERRIAQAVPNALLTRLEAPPVVGAALMALDQLGSRPTPEVQDRLSRSLITAFR